MNNSFSSFSKILNGINSTLNIVNKAVPLYKEVSPMISTVNKTYKNIKNNKTNISNTIKLLKLKNTIKKDITPKINTQPNNKIQNNINNPKFFI